MGFGDIIASPRSTLSAVQALDLAKIYLENARNATDTKITLVLCHDTEVSLSQAKKAAKHFKDNTIRDVIAATYTDLGEVLFDRSYHSEAQATFEKAQKLGAPAHDLSRFAPPRLGTIVDSAKNMSHSRFNPSVTQLSVQQSTLLTPSRHRQGSSVGSVTSAHPTSTAVVPRTYATAQGDTNGTLPQVKTAAPTNKSAAPVRDLTVVSLTTPEADIATIPLNIFVGNVRPPVISFKPPEADERLNDTLQLACCLGLLQVSASLDDILDPTVHNWLKATKTNTDEQQRLKAMARNVIRAFKRDELKDSKAVTEVVYLAPVLDKEDFQYLLREFYSGVDHSGLLDVRQLEGLAQLIQGANTGFIEADDLVKILQLLSKRLQTTHSQSPAQIYTLSLAVSHVLDAMADAGVKNLDRVTLHEPLAAYLDKLKKSSDSFLVYQAAYASQALLYVPDNESLGQAALRRTGKVIQGVSGLVSAVKGLDLNGFMGGLKEIQNGLAGVSQAIEVAKTAFEGAKSLAEG
ncbi:hypothetical protein BGX31_011571, partial [Mortierella sp. GBA43]